MLVESVDDIHNCDRVTKRCDSRPLIMATSSSVSSLSTSTCCGFSSCVCLRTGRLLIPCRVGLRSTASLLPIYPAFLLGDAVTLGISFSFACEASFLGDSFMLASPLDIVSSACFGDSKSAREERLEGEVGVCALFT